MEQFNPDMRLMAVDEHDVIVSFDSASANDHARGAKAIRIARDFAEISVAVDGFTDTELSSLGDKKEFRGAVKLIVKDRAGAASEYVLAEPVLWVGAVARNRKAATYSFPAAEQVVLSVRQGMADALSYALAEYYSKEAHMDTLSRSPAPVMLAGAAAVQGAVSEVRAAPQLALAKQHGEINYRKPIGAANDADKKKLRNRLLAAAVITPLVVWGALAATVGTANNDPIKNAVAQAMTEDPRSVQAQVDLTKETLKQMGLDPGKAADTGCLAPQ